MKKILYGIAMFLLIIGFWKLFDDCTMDRQEKPNMQVFRITDSVFQNYGIYDSECSIEGCYFYGEEYLSEDVAHELLGKIAKGIGITGEYEFDRVQTDSGYQTRITKNGEDSDFTLSLNTVENKSNKNISQSQYIVVDLKIKNSVSSGIYYRDHIGEVMKKYVHNKGDITTDLCIKGNIYGKPGDKIQKNIAKTVLSEAGAGKVFEHTEEDSYSVYAYASQVGNYITIGHNKINLNVAFSYNEQKNITEILVGSPIVNYDY